MTTNESPPLVSVIMANYNGASLISEALQSVLAQTLSDIEILVSDDASSDQSVAIVQKIMARDSRVKLLNSTHNTGPGAARNRALEVARGIWIAIVDTDDLIHPRRFERMIEMATKLQTSGIADDLLAFGSGHIDSSKSLFSGLRQQRPMVVTAELLIASENHPGKQVPLGYLKPLLRRDALNNLRYRQDIQTGEDQDFYARFLLSGGQLHLLEQCYYLYRRHQNSFSHRLSAKDITGMIQAQNDILNTYSNMSPALKFQFQRRTSTLNNLLSYEALVALIKQRKLFGALKKLAQHPALLPFLLRSTQEHFSRRNQGSNLAQSETFNLALDIGTESQDGFLVAGNNLVLNPGTDDYFAPLSVDTTVCKSKEKYS